MSAATPLAAPMHPALAAWLNCPEADSWPRAIDRLVVADWRGVRIGWPQFETEVFAIYRLDDSSVVDEEELPSDKAADLNWRPIDLGGVVRWQS